VTAATTNSYVDDAVTSGEIPDGHTPHFGKIIVVDPDGHTEQFGRIIVVIMMAVYLVMVQGSLHSVSGEPPLLPYEPPWFEGDCLDLQGEPLLAFMAQG
jgi:hypothetical protein